MKRFSPPYMIIGSAIDEIRKLQKQISRNKKEIAALEETLECAKHKIQFLTSRIDA